MKKIKLLSRSLIEVFGACPKYNFSMFLVLIIIGVMPALNVYATGELVNLFENKDTRFSVLSIIILWGVSMLLPTILTPLVNYLQSHINQLVTNKITSKIIKKNSEFNGLETFDDAKIQDSITILKNQSRFRPTNFLVNLVIVIREGITIASLSIILFSIKWWIPITLLVSAIPLAYINFLVASFSWKALINSGKDTRIMEYFTSLSFLREAQKDIHLFRAHNIIYTKYKDAFQKVYNELKKAQIKIFVKPLPFQIFTTVSISIILFTLYKQTNASLIELSSVVILLQSIVLLNSRLEGLIQHSSLLYEILDYFDKYFHFLGSEDSIIDGDKEINYINSIEFDNVYFKYPNNDRYILNGVSFCTKSGESIAIVGHNGAGKSTLVHLICRFWDVTEGKILINGLDIKLYKIASLRECIGAVFQDYFKFNMTVKENITFNNLEISEIKQNNHKLPIGINMETLLGKSFGGIDISGGQWQRLAILRCFHTNGSLIILDEPTSAIDPKSEVELYDEFKRLASGKLSFMVTHRLGSVNNTNRILVLDNGYLVQDGSPEVLKTIEGTFKELWNLQSNMYL